MDWIRRLSVRAMRTYIMIVYYNEYPRVINIVTFQNVDFCTIRRMISRWNYNPKHDYVFAV
jgi:hypothetical protein